MAIVPCSAIDDLAVPNDRPRRNAADAQDRDLRVVDDRRLEQPGELARARDGERRATHARPASSVPSRAASASRAISAWISATDFSSAPADDRDDETLLRLHGDADVAALEVDDVVAVEARVQLGELGAASRRTP